MTLKLGKIRHFKGSPAEGLILEGDPANGRYCSTCKHFFFGERGTEDFICGVKVGATEKTVKTLDVVTGRVRFERSKLEPNCYDMRANGGECGPEGKLFDEAPMAPQTDEWETRAG